MLEHTPGESVIEKESFHSLAGWIGEVLKISEIRDFLSTSAKGLGFPFVSKIA